MYNCDICEQNFINYSSYYVHTLTCFRCYKNYLQCSTLEDIEDDNETWQSSQVEPWSEYDEDYAELTETDAYIKDDEDGEKGKKEEEKEEIAEKEVIDETDIMEDYMSKFEAKRAKELWGKIREKKVEILRLIEEARIKERDDVSSEETPITPEEEVAVSDRTTTESSIHLCLREIDISESQLKILNPYIVYPIPDDPGLRPAFWLLRESPPVYSTDGVQKFYDTAKRFRLRPIASLRDMFLSDQLNLRYYGVQPLVFKVICDALVDNTFVQKIDLKDNKLSADACEYLNNLLLRNNMITDLSLSGCQIGANGVKNLCDALMTNAIVKTLDLSRCNIENKGFEHIAFALSNNDSLQSVNLSDNRLDESCSGSLQHLLSRSQTLTHLDLSWNSLNSAETIKALVDGLIKNEVLRLLNLSWNSLDSECVPHLNRLLVRSQALETLNLSCNRFNEEDAASIATALSQNNKLQQLYLGNNPLKAEGALALVRAISHSSSDAALRLLDLENIWAKKDILPELKTIETFKPWVKIRLGGILSNYPLVGPNVKRILLDRANYEAMKHKKQRRNFGHFVMSLDDGLVSQKKFEELINNFELQLPKSLIDEIVKEFTKPTTKTVDLQLLKSSYLKEYPETVALQEKKKPPKKTKVAKKKPKKT